LALISSKGFHMSQAPQVHIDLVEHAAGMLSTAQQAFIRAGMNAGHVEAVATLAAALIVAAAQKD